MIKIIEIENFLSLEACNWLINFHKNNFEKTLNKYSHYHRTTEAIDLSNIIELDETKKLIAHFTSHIRTINKKAYINYFQIVRWPSRESQPAHIDKPEHILTSILYLNDNFKGGETKVGNKIIKPKAGKIVTFEGNKVKHSVRKIIEGQRYTVPIWYKI